MAFDSFGAVADGDDGVVFEVDDGVHTQLFVQSRRQGTHVGRKASSRRFVEKDLLCAPRCLVVVPNSISRSTICGRDASLLASDLGVVGQHANSLIEGRNNPCPVIAHQAT